LLPHCHMAVRAVKGLKPIIINLKWPGVKLATWWFIRQLKFVDSCTHILWNKCITWSIPGFNPEIWSEESKLVTNLSNTIHLTLVFLKNFHWHYTNCQFLDQPRPHHVHIALTTGPSLPLEQVACNCLYSDQLNASQYCYTCFCLHSKK